MFLLFAKPGIGDIAEIIIAVVVVLIAILRQIFEANKQAGKKAAVPGPQPQAGPKPAAAGGQQADPLRSQVEEFLRRAGQKAQAGQQQAPQQRPASEIEVLVDGSRPPQRRTLVESNRPNDSRRSQAGKPSVPISDKRQARRSVTPKRRVTLAERAAVREEKRVGHLVEQQPHLGQRIIEEDKQFDEQLKAKFDHAVGTLGGSNAAAAAQPASPPRESPAAQIAAMLVNPEGVRQAVILNEILTRPSDRW